MKNTHGQIENLRLKTGEHDVSPQQCACGPPAPARSSRRAGRAGPAAAASRRAPPAPAAPASPPGSACGSSPPVGWMVLGAVTVRSKQLECSLVDCTFVKLTD